MSDPHSAVHSHEMPSGAATRADCTPTPEPDAPVEVAEGHIDNEGPQAVVPWRIVLVAYAVGVLVTFAQFAVPPILPALRERLAIDYGQAGMLMTVFAIATLIFATPCGVVIQRYGVRRVGLAGLVILTAGLGVCLFASSYGVFLLGRAVQGVGFGLVAVTAPTAIGQFVPPRGMPMAMGLWSTWIPFGNLVVFFVAPRVLQYASMPTYWLLLIAVMVPGFVAYALVIPRMPTVSSAADAIPPRQVLVDELRNPHVLAAGIAFAAFTFGVFSLTTWTTSYLHETMGMTLVAAAAGTLVYAVASICSDLYGGLLLQRFGHRAATFVLRPFLLLMLWPLFTVPRVPVFLATIAIFSLISGVIPPIIFAAAPLLARHHEGVGVATAVIIVGENLGLLVGPQVFGWLRQATGGYRLSFMVMMSGPVVMMLALWHIHRTGVFARTGSG